MKSKGIDVKTQVKSIASEFGVDESVAEQIAQKCYESVYWRPYGGATSFAEIDQAEATREYSYKVDDETYKLRAIVENITESDDLDVSAKTTNIQKAASDYQARVSALEVTRGKSFWKKFKDLLGIKEEYEDEEDEDEEEDDEKENEKTLIVSTKSSNLLIVKDKETGRDRWISTSSNSFEDLEKELFSQKALEEAVEYAEKNNSRGPLMFFHIKGTEIGSCDSQFIVGRFLVESGLFDETEIGRKAAEYFKSTDEEWQTSIGYIYEDGDELDGVYEWLRFRERSICPFGTAANPYTSFKVMGEDEMNAVHKAAMEKVFGSELTESIISKHETQTKELEEANVRFKSFDMEAFATEIAKKSGVSPERAVEVAKKVAAEVAGMKEDGPEPKPDPEPEPEPEPKPDEANVQLAQFAELFKTFGDTLESIQNDLKGMKTEIKELQISDDEKVAREMAPRFSQVKTQRPTESEDNTIDDAELAKSVKEHLADEKTANEGARGWANLLTRTN